jgi:6-pyruvoyltetrahydropterin/6-carboxytetrahydropterin synthase
MLITRRVEFSASHRCSNPAWTDEQNQAAYGPAANPAGHGHNFVLQVTLDGAPDPVTGMVFDLKLLKDILHQEVVEPFDHRSLNHEVPPFDRIVPTAENICVEIWRRLEPRLNTASARLHSVRLYETADLFVDCFGDRP